MEHRTILIIAAHPDDVDFGTSGSVALWTREKRNVEYLICTSGEKGFNSDSARSMPTSERRAIRETEQRASAAVVGVETVHFLRYPDGEMTNSPSLRRDMVRVMRKLKPELVVAVDPSHRKWDSFYGFHSDHRAVSQAAFDALYPAVGNQNFYPELLDDGLAPHHPKEVYFNHPSEPNLWVDITETFDLKLEALACHKSQIENIDQLAPHMRDWAKRSGEAGGLPCAESFRRLEIPE